MKVERTTAHSSLRVNFSCRSRLLSIMHCLLVVALFAQTIAPAGALGRLFAPGAFSKQSPANRATDVPNNPTLRWTSASGAAYYGYCIDKTLNNTCDAGSESYVRVNGTSATLSLEPNTDYSWQARAYTSANDWTPADGAGAWFTFRTAALPGNFAKQSPANGATGVLSNATLSWTSASGAAYYAYCIDTTNDNTCDAGGETGFTRVDGTSVVLSLQPNTTYSWQARAYNAVGGFTPADGAKLYFTFTTSNAPGAFRKLGPIDTAQGGSVNPTLTWSSASGAAYYAYCIDTTDNDTCDAGSEAGFVRVNGTSATLSNLQPNTTYSWQVRAYNAAGEFTPADGAKLYFTFTTAQLPGGLAKQSPPDGATGVTPNTTLRWTSASHTVSYAYCIDTTDNDTCDAGGVTGFVRVGDTLATLNLQPNTMYSWQVRAYNSASDFTPADGPKAYFTFTTAAASAAPGALRKASPLPGATTAAQQVTLAWGAAAGATEYGYCIDTSANATCDSPQGYIKVAGTSVTLPELELGKTYSWQVRAYNSGGYTPADGVGGWWSFTTGAGVGLPGAFTKRSPTNGATDQPTTITLEWTDALNATHYGFCINTNPQLGCAGGDSGYTRVNGTRFTPRDLVPGTTYYWQARAYSSTGHTPADGVGAWWSFTTVATAPLPGAFAKAEPADKGRGLPTSVTLRWSAADGATSFGYCIDTTPNATCDAGGAAGYVPVSGTSATITGLAPNTVYSWQARAYSAGGHRPADGVGNWWTFLTAPAAGLPDAPRKVAPVDNASRQSTSVTLAWEAVPNATGYGYCLNIDQIGCEGGPAGYTPVAGTSVTLNDLEPDTTYYWQIHGNNANGLTAADGVGMWWKFTTDSAAGDLAGTTNGQFVVNEGGAANYTIPLAIPPGTGGLAPQLTLTYDSRNGLSLLGNGWSLAGMSAVTRCPTTIAQHGYVDGVDFDSNDQFCLDGQLLVSQNGPSGGHGTTYRTENETFTKIVSNGQEGVGPQYFQSWTKAGLYLEYGRTPLSRTVLQGRPDVLAWGVNRIEDTKGNYLKIKYEQDPGNNQTYPIRIDYTGNDAANLAPYSSVNFIYEERPDTISQYVGGSLIRVARRLVAIQTWFDTSLVWEYRFQYKGGRTISRSRLIRMTECAGDGTCFRPTQFVYSSPVNDPPTFEAPGSSAWVAHPKGFDHTLSGDFNGDGRTDLATRTDTNQGNLQVWRVCLATGASFSCGDWLGQRAPLSDTIVGDFNGDGLTDITGNFPNSDQWHVCLSTGVLFDCQGWAAHGEGRSNTLTGDFNGDGRTDLLGRTGHSSASGKQDWRVCLSTGTTFNCSTWAGHRGVVNETIVGEFNGDGVTDFAGYDNQQKRWHICTATGTAFDCSFWTAHAEGRENTLAGDFNGDGRTDLIGRTNKAQGGFQEWQVCLATGTGFACSVWLGQQAKVEDSVVSDFNGDGFTDLAAYTGRNRDWHVCLASGTTFICTFTAIHDRGGKKNVSGDFNGDGKLDFAGYTGADGQWQVQLAAGQVNNLLTQVINGHGAQLTIEYKPLTDASVYTKDHDATYPRLDVQGPLFVVAAHESSNGIGGVSRTTYHYTGLKRNLRGRGLLGFRMLRATDEQTGIATITYYRQDYPYNSMVLRTEQQLPSGVIVKTVDHTWAALSYNQPNLPGMILTTADTQAASHPQTQPVQEYRVFLPFLACDTCTGTSTGTVETPPVTTPDMPLLAEQSSMDSLSLLAAPNTGRITYFIYVQQEVVRNFELDGSLVNESTTSYEYDSYGNPVTVVVQDGDGGQQTTRNAYTNDSSRWHLGRLTATEVTAVIAGQPAQTRRSQFTYDPGSGLLIREVIEPGTTVEQVKSYAHDSYGNIVRSSVSGPNETERVQRTEYNQRGRFSNKSINALDQVETRSNHGFFGTVTQRTDSNGLITTYMYDGFGRPTGETRPDGGTTTQAYRLCDTTCPSFARYYLRTETSGAPLRIVFYDLLDRQVRTETRGFDGRPIYVDTEYDERGQTRRTSEPYYGGEQPAWTTMEYDIVGRVVVAIAPDGERVVTRYHGLTTQTRNGLDQAQVRKLNQRGLLVESTDALGGKLTYTYDSFNNLIATTDGAGAKIELVYDQRGRKVGMTDPDLGSITYQYNTFDELVAQHDAKQQTATLSYDRLGRMIERQESEGKTTWVYDTQPQGIGKLTQVTGSDGYQMAYNYDNLGRVVVQTTTIDGVARQFQTSYDQFSRVLTLAYPSGFTLRHTYNDHQYLADIHNATNGTVYWRTDALNARGQVQAETLGNQLVTTRRYDVLGHITAVQTGPSGSPTVQNLAYTYDLLGNLKSRVDIRQGLNENFSYDLLNRLTEAQVVGQSAISTSYDALGNITAKSDVGQYTYAEAGAGPHAVTSITGPGANHYTYDANGNRISSGNGSAVYTSYNKPKELIEGEITTQLTYAPDRELYKQVVQQTQTVSTTVYIGGLYEQETAGTLVRERHYIAGGKGVIAVATTEASTTTVRYLHSDHLGSVDTITDESGNVIERLSFDAWGKRRNANWQIATATIRSVVDRGYTGHRQLDAVGLIHMRGRVYDPAIGRFLSADPFIQMPEYSQSLNRYSYVINNPLSLTDPSGYRFSGIKNFFKKNWKSLVAAAVTIVTGGLAAGVLGPVLAGALGGFAGSFTGTILNGGSLSQALTAGLRGGLIGAFTAGAASGLHDVGYSVLKIAAHGTVGGIRSVFEGGKFEHGFISGVITETFSPWVDLIDRSNPGINPYRTAAAAIIGGTAAEIGGGKFANGAITGAFARIYNHDGGGRKGGLIQQGVRDVVGWYSESLAEELASFELDGLIDRLPHLSQSEKNFIKFAKDGPYTWTQYAVEEITGFPLLPDISYSDPKATFRSVNNTLPYWEIYYIQKISPAIQSVQFKVGREVNSFIHSQFGCVMKICG